MTRNLSHRLRNMTRLQTVTFFSLLWGVFFVLSQFRPIESTAGNPLQIIIAICFFLVSWLMGSFYGLLTFALAVLSLWMTVSGQMGSMQNPLMLIPIQTSINVVVVIVLLGRLGTSERRAHQAAEDAYNANYAKSRFLANMSHELRTPLAAITGYAELVAEQVENAHVAKRMQKIISASSLLQVHINSILDFANLETGKMTVDWQTVSLPELLESVIASLHPLFAQQQNRFTLNMTENALPEITTDAQKVSQILFNVLQNANKFTQNGTIELSVVQTTHQITLQVKDSGIGMTEEQLDRVFLPFMQADMSTTREYGGTGLGLAITQQLCHLLGGDILVESELNIGTIVTVNLPIS